MQKWEYMVLAEENPLENQLKECGAEGWELVSAFFDGSLYIYYFKRPLD